MLTTLRRCGSRAPRAVLNNASQMKAGQPMRLGNITDGVMDWSKRRNPNPCQGVNGPMMPGRESREITKLRSIAAKARRLADALSWGEGDRLHRRADALEQDADRLERAEASQVKNEKPVAE